MRTLFLMACLALTACDLSPPPERQTEADKKADEHHELRNAIQTPIDKAKSVDQTQKDADDAERQRIKDEGG